MIEEEALKDNTSQALAIVPVPIASYLLNEKRRSINHIERVQEVKITIVPDSDMETPHFEVIRVREGEEQDLLSYLLPKKLEALREAEAKEAGESEVKPRKVEQPALQALQLQRKLRQHQRQKRLRRNQLLSLKLRSRAYSLVFFLQSVLYSLHLKQRRKSQRRKKKQTKTATIVRAVTATTINAVATTKSLVTTIATRIVVTSLTVTAMKRKRRKATLNKSHANLRTVVTSSKTVVIRSEMKPLTNRRLKNKVSKSLLTYKQRRRALVQKISAQKRKLPRLKSVVSVAN
ncbi:ribonuclease E [Vibrio variabilis]|uniref:Ribonuclease E n=1 Tax=Vibrio variabilis TaxID=990271 RepID=A0ABQ0JC69_9VIBR|nr:ribonuclease E [Vibrio variabilis]